MSHCRVMDACSTLVEYRSNRVKSRYNLGNACYHSVQNLLSSRLLYNHKKTEIYVQRNNSACSVWV
jgi:hypothetical protein